MSNMVSDILDILYPCFIPREHYQYVYQLVEHVRKAQELENSPPSENRVLHRKRGRPPKLSGKKLDDVRDFIHKQKIPVQYLAKQLGIGRSTLYEHVHERTSKKSSKK